MPTRRRSTPPPESRELLTARIAELELRIQLLEARVRHVAKDVRKQAPVEKGAKLKPVRERPRCPGCVLELPPGKRGESCVWCGFVFDAVAPMKRKASR